MLFNEYKNLFFEFCDKTIRKEIHRSRTRYNYAEEKCIALCTLNVRAEDDSDEEVVDLLEGEIDVNIDPLLPFVETIDNDEVAKFLKLLSVKEQDVVSLRLRYLVPIKSVNCYLRSNRKQATTRVFKRAINKLKKNLNVDEKGE